MELIDFTAECRAFFDARYQPRRRERKQFVMPDGLTTGAQHPIRYMNVAHLEHPRDNPRLKRGNASGYEHARHLVPQVTNSSLTATTAAAGGCQVNTP